MIRLVLIVVMSMGITMLLRLLPFLAFSGERNMPSWLERLGKILPPAIMPVLCVYCLKDVKTDFLHTGIPELIAAVVTVVSYKLRHSIFWSILLGTATCMILLQVFS